MQELIVIEPKSVREVFVSEDGIDPILAKIKSEIDKFSVLDMSVKKDRDEVKARVTKIKKCKTYLENTGKDLAAELKKEPKLVDASRKKAKDQLTQWEDEVRKPLTEWQEAEKRRIDAIHKEINAMRESSINLSGVETRFIEENLCFVRAIEINDFYAEFKEYAQQTKDAAIAELERFLCERRKYEKEKAELEELRALKAAQEEKERKEAEAKEAERKAAEAKEAEEKRIKEAEERARKEAEEMRLKEKQEAERKALELQQKAEAAERAAKEAAEEAERKIAEAKAAHEQKIIDERLAEEAAARKREENLAHAKKINNQAVKCLMRIGRIDKELAIEIVTAIAKKEIDNVSIKY